MFWILALFRNHFDCRMVIFCIGLNMGFVASVFSTSLCVSWRLTMSTVPLFCISEGFDEHSNRNYHFLVPPSKCTSLLSVDSCRFVGCHVWGK